MEELIKLIESYAKAMGKSESYILQKAANTSGRAWKVWKNGGDCSVRIAERVKKYMKDNPPPKKPKGAQHES